MNNQCNNTHRPFTNSSIDQSDAPLQQKEHHTKIQPTCASRGGAKNLEGDGTLARQRNKSLTPSSQLYSGGLLQEVDCMAFCRTATMKNIIADIWQTSLDSSKCRLNRYLITHSIRSLGSSILLALCMGQQSKLGNGNDDTVAVSESGRYDGSQWPQARSRASKTQLEEQPETRDVKRQLKKRRSTRVKSCPTRSWEMKLLAAPSMEIFLFFHSPSWIM